MKPWILVVPPMRYLPMPPFSPLPKSVSRTGRSVFRSLDSLTPGITTMLRSASWVGRPKFLSTSVALRIASCVLMFL